ncbi:hypothetical protein PTSG_09367 [Salpingoeca rosetta]|uniref:Uncharacterized protein n=1 Tax=Salpingoeca rosetta (strain ATCC 50818 / BSB-021) TaxID=946362 RepID=F2UMF2_SALR5|nr:uncharacterized protein PTSG_09367 [Salpingoeca rosetta]EGD78301.1 hypothetical protein PTSG_09367 [Salpingoeca rosetta]|eukprot:XP_004989624.1 hypothetical protein PTSG_09367 [Salpingoeca rosetta]
MASQPQHKGKSKEQPLPAPAGKLRRGTRSFSVIDQRQVKEALARRRLTRAEKRERNKTIVGTQASQLQQRRDADDDTTPPSEEMDSQLMKELEMRRDIMKLQKEHILQLQTEMKKVQDENQLLIQTLASKERQLSDLRLKMELLSGDTMKILQESNRRQSLVADAQQDELQEHEQVIEDLTQERDEALGKVQSLLGLIEDLATAQQVEGKEHMAESARAVKSALKLTGDDKFAALAGVREGLLARWSQEDLDREVARQNAFLDEYLDSVTLDVSVSTDDGATDSMVHLSSFQRRMRPKLRGLLRSTNDVRIRSTAISEPASVAPSLNASLNLSSSSNRHNGLLRSPSSALHSDTLPARPWTSSGLPSRTANTTRHRHHSHRSHHQHHGGPSAPFSSHALSSTSRSAHSLHVPTASSARTLSHAHARSPRATNGHTHTSRLLSPSRSAGSVRPRTADAASTRRRPHTHFIY